MTTSPSEPSDRPTDEVLGAPAAAPRGGWRQRVRSKPGLREVYRVAVFVLGLLFILAGFALAVLPGPLTIPPVLFGLYIWSTEFAWAKRFFDAFAVKGREAWAQAKAHPVRATIITVGGLIAAGAVIWAVNRYELVDKAREAIGI